MTFNFVDLVPETRALMIEELKSDIAAGRVLQSTRTRPGTEGTYNQLQLDAFESGTSDTLVSELINSGIFRDRQNNGAQINVPASAAALGDGQFVAYYDRAICLRALAEDREIEVYRGQETAQHRAESDALIGSHPDPATLLQNLREHSTETWVLGGVVKVNSGLTIKLV